MATPPTDAAAADWMIYGANGYTGRLIAQEAARRGLRPTLAGRSHDAIERLAGECGCPARVFGLEVVDDIAKQLTDFSGVLNCAGPFSATAIPMMEAALAAGNHYLDITGEIDCIEAAAGRHKRAVDRGVVLIPAIGCDVVPTDCLAARMAEQLPSATQLQLAFCATEPPSSGTAKTMIESLPKRGRVRIDHRITTVPIAWKLRRIRFHNGLHWAMTIPWGDVSSAYHSTGIPNIEVYLALPRKQIIWARRLRCLVPLAGLRLVQSWLKHSMDRKFKGSSADERDGSRVSIWGRVADDSGAEIEATLEIPSGYTLTVSTALAAIDKLRTNPATPGFATPSRAFGHKFILEIPDVMLYSFQRKR